jgi:hypothetical protein
MRLGSSTRKQRQEASDDRGNAEEIPRRLIFAKKKDWYLTQAYSDVFEILRSQNSCNVPADVGHFLPGSRRARALILLHELAHLIEGENGAWLIPDDGYNVEQSRANTLRIQTVCRAQLETLK